MNVRILNVVGKWVAKVNRDRKPKIKFTTDGEPYNNQENQSKWFCYLRSTGR